MRWCFILLPINLRPLAGTGLASSLLLISLSLLGTEAWAKKYALVIGGRSKMKESSSHEFARQTLAVSKGLSEKKYNVTTLFGTGAEEKKKYKRDYQYFEKLETSAKITLQDSTPREISDYFEQLTGKINPGDQVEIYITAHGSDTCGEDADLYPSDLGSPCTHTFSIFDGKGRPVEYDSQKLFSHIKKLEAKGALPTIVFDSCHSGRLKSQLKKVGLQKTCSYFQTAGNETGYGCFEDDPEFSRDFTSTGEFVSLRYYQHILGDLSKDPYFSEKNCFNKVKDHFKNKKMSVNTVNSAYESSRLYDETAQSPSTSDQLSIDYFSRGVLFADLSEKRYCSYPQVNQAIEHLKRQTLKLKGFTLSAVKIPLKEAIKNYNHHRKILKEALTKKNKTSDKIFTLQQNLRRASKKVIQEERKLIHGFYKSTTKSSNCDRTL